jgi:hypothetical protein
MFINVVSNNHNLFYRRSEQSVTDSTSIARKLYAVFKDCEKKAGWQFLELGVIRIKKFLS